MYAPKLLIEAEFKDLDSEVIDATSFMARIAKDNPKRFQSLLAGERPFVHEFSLAWLSETHRAAAYRGEMKMPGFTEKLNAFAAAAGLPASAKAFVQHLEDVRMEGWSLESLRRLKNSAEKASFVQSGDHPNMFFLPLSDDKYAFHPEELVEDWGFDTFHAMDPRPNDSEAYKAWEKRYDAWVEEHRLPFVHGTSSTGFKSITADAVLEAVKDHELSAAQAFDLLIEHELEHHYEDAGEDLIGTDETLDAIRTWEQALEPKLDYETVGTLPDHEKRNLAATLDIFNGKQTITSYYEDSSVLTPLNEKTSKAECLAAIDRLLGKAEAEYEQAKTGWNLPAAAA
jgi:hypothetical protein